MPNLALFFVDKNIALDENIAISLILQYAILEIQAALISYSVVSQHYDKQKLAFAHCFHALEQIHKFVLRCKNICGIGLRDCFCHFSRLFLIDC